MKTKKEIRFRAEIRIKGKRYSKTLESEEAASKWISMHESLKMGGAGSNQYERKMALGQALLFSFEISQKMGVPFAKLLERLTSRIHFFTAN